MAPVTTDRTSAASDNITIGPVTSLTASTPTHTSAVSTNTTASITTQNATASTTTTASTAASATTSATATIILTTAATTAVIDPLVTTSIANTSTTAANVTTTTTTPANESTSSSAPTIPTSTTSGVDSNSTSSVTTTDATPSNVSSVSTASTPTNATVSTLDSNTGTTTFTVDNVTATVDLTDGVLLLTMDTGLCMEKQKCSFKCTYLLENMSSVQTNLAVSAPLLDMVRIGWRRNGNPILSNSARVRVLHEQNTREYQLVSQLVFDGSKWSDSGDIACVAYNTTGQEFISQNLTLSVLAIPRISVQPAVASVVSGEVARVTCHAHVPSLHPGSLQPPKFTWFRDGHEISKNTFDEISSVTPFVSQLESIPLRKVVYGCQASNLAGASPIEDVTLEVIEPDDEVCDDNMHGGIQWALTRVKSLNLQPCLHGATGMVSRRCVAKRDKAAERSRAVWEEANWNNCVGVAFVHMNEQVVQLLEGLGGNSVAIADKLQQHTENSTHPRGLSAGEVNVAIDVAQHLVQYERAKTKANHSINATAAIDILQAMSNTLGERNMKAWQQLQMDMPNKPVSLMKTIDDVASLLASTLKPNTEMNVESPSLIIQVQRRPKNATSDVRYPKLDPDMPDWLETTDSIVLQADTLASISAEVPGDDFKISSAYYRTLGELIPTNRSRWVVNTKIIAMSLNLGDQVIKLAPPVKLTFQHSKQIKNTTANCSFWDYSFSDAPGKRRGGWSTEGCWLVSGNISQSECHCNHLTNFAILMSPVRAEGIHHQILSIITLVGCIISILGLFLTLLLFCAIWKNVKSHHAAVLVNLCIALIIANVIFLVGVEQTERETVCTIVAALLHYFYLAAFFIMLAEGVQLLLYIVFVFHVRRKRETAMLLIVGWGLPAVIVGACLGITKTEGYGGDDFCWLSVESGLLYAFVVPAIIVILINIVILVIVLRRVTTARMPAENKKHHKLKAAVWNMAVVCPILGITWLFGVFSVNKETVAFQYIFAVSNSLQGLLIFIFHAVFNKKKGDYSVKLSSSTKRSRLKSDPTSSSSKTSKSSKGSKGSKASKSSKGSKGSKGSNVSRMPNGGEEELMNQFDKVPMTAHERNAIMVERSAAMVRANKDRANKGPTNKERAKHHHGKNNLNKKNDRSKKELAGCFDEVRLNNGHVERVRVRPPPRTQVFGRMEQEGQPSWNSDTPGAPDVGEVTYSNATFMPDDDSTRL